MRTNPENAYRNGTMYSSYTAEQLARTADLAELAGVNLRGSVTWAFEFEDQPYFAGFRDLASNGIDKPVLDVFRMLGMMAGDRLAVSSTGGLPLEKVRDAGVREAPDVSAIASRAERALAVMVWNYHADDLPAPAANVELEIAGVQARSATLAHYRIDAAHSNAYEAWKKIGSPQPPNSAQQAELEKAGRLEMLGAPTRVRPRNGGVALTFTLPRQGVSLVRLSW
jgi:xylan 1,4-beta-xylosidase